MPSLRILPRRFPVALTEDAWRKLKRFSDDAGLTHDQALIFLFENFGSVTDESNLTHRLRLFKAELETD